MAEKLRDDKILIEQLPRRGISSVVYTLKVPIVFILPEYDNKISNLYSPTFAFINSTWRFRIESDIVEKELNVYLERIDFKKLKQWVFYEIELLDEKDEVYEHHVDVAYFNYDKTDCIYKVFFGAGIEVDSSHHKGNFLAFMVHLIHVESTEREADQVMRSKMTEEVGDCKVSIRQLPRRGISSAVYSLKVPNTLTLAEYDNTTSEFYSTTFEFINSTLRFVIEPYINGLYRELRVLIQRVNFKKQKRWMFYELKLQGGKDEVYDAGELWHIEDGDENYLCVFCNKDPSHDKHDVLNLIVHLISVESAEMEADQVLMRRSGLSLSDDFKSMLLNGQDYNLTFNVNNKQFRAHQDILRARSDVFRSMLTHDMLEKNRGIIDVPDIDPEAFEQLLFYIYSGKVETLDESIMFGLYYAADKYNLDGLKEECCEFIKKSLTNTNVCDALNLATKHSDEGLLNSAMNYFLSNIDNILLTVEWQLFMRDNYTEANELIIKSLKKIREAQTT